MSLLGQEMLFESDALQDVLLGIDSPGSALFLEEEAKKEHGKEKEKPKDAIMEAKAHLSEMVNNGKPKPGKGEEKGDSARVAAHFSVRPKNCYAAVSYSVRSENERAKGMFENVKGLFPKAIRDIAYDRKAGGGQMHYSFRMENAKISFRFVPGHGRGSYGCTVYVKADTSSHAKAYFATLVGGLPAWAKSIYHESLKRAKHEAADVEYFGGLLDEAAVLV
jgi:hypothetical protein